ncbi:hypothetical protein [Streptomyces tibetensis]
MQQLQVSDDAALQAAPGHGPRTASGAGPEDDSQTDDNSRG